MLRFWQKRQALKRQAQAEAQAALIDARDPAWYRDFLVPDTFDGRFDVAVLALFIRLYRQPDLGQFAFNAFFRQMELTLREMGVGDLGVPRHMKRMMTGFNGRLRAYWLAASKADQPAMQEALARNVYGTVPDIAPEMVEKLAADVLKRLETVGERHEIAAP